MSDNISIQDRTRNFANRVIKAYVELNKKHYDDAGKVLSRAISQIWYIYRS